MAHDYSIAGFGGGSTKKLCGPRLVEVLALVCNNEYNPLTTNKRSGTDALFDDYPYNEQSLLDGMPTQYQSLGYLSKLMPETTAIRSRVRREWIIHRGVFDECCQKACSINELRQYCRARK